MRFGIASFILGSFIVVGNDSAADTISPIYRLEPIGIQGPWDIWTRIHFDEETGSTTTMGMHFLPRRGDYRMENREVEPGVTEAWLIRGDGDSNLLPADIAQTIRYEDFNAKGQVLGSLRTSQPTTFYVFDSNTGERTWLPGPVDPGAGTNVVAQGIDDSGRIVGGAYAFVPQVGWRLTGRYLWESPDSIPVRIDDRIVGLGDWYDIALHDIGNDGTIYGWGFYREYSKRGEFALIPVSASDLTDEELIDFDSGSGPSPDTTTPDSGVLPEPVPVAEPSTWIIAVAGSALFRRSVRKWRS